MDTQPIEEVPKYKNSPTFFGDTTDDRCIQQLSCRICGAPHGIWKCQEFIHRAFLTDGMSQNFSTCVFVAWLKDILENPVQEVVRADRMDAKSHITGCYTVMKVGSHVEWNQSQVSWTHATATSLMYRKVPQTNGSLSAWRGMTTNNNDKTRQYTGYISGVHSTSHCTNCTEEWQLINAS